jgi:hypothetical protein
LGSEGVCIAHIGHKDRADNCYKSSASFTCLLPVCISPPYHTTPHSSAPPESKPSSPRPAPAARFTDARRAGAQCSCATPPPRGGVVAVWLQAAAEAAAGLARARPPAGESDAHSPKSNRRPPAHSTRGFGWRSPTRPPIRAAALAPCCRSSSSRQSGRARSVAAAASRRDGLAATAAALLLQTAAPFAAQPAAAEGANVMSTYQPMEVCCV